VKINWFEVAKLVWSNKWEAVLGIVGLLIPAVMGELPPWAVILCSFLAFVLILDVARAVSKSARLVQEKHLPLLTVVDRDRDKARADVQEVQEAVAGLGFEPRRFQDEFGIEQDDWVLYREEPLDAEPSGWMELCRRFLSNVQRLERLQGRKVFHVFHDGPTALAMGLGASLATRHLLVLHHRQPGVSDSNYIPVMDFTTPGANGITPLLRLRNQPSSPFQYITVHPPHNWTPHVFMSLRLITTELEPDFSALATTQESAFVAVRNQYGGTLTADLDWIQVAQQAAWAVREVCSRPDVQRVHLAFTCTTPLAFGIGMALGIHLPVRVYSWFSDQRIYAPVMDLDKLRPLGQAHLAVLPPDVPDKAAVPAWKHLVQLRRVLVDYFDEGELKTLCFDLGVEYEVLPGQGKANKARDLVIYLQHRGRIPELVKRVQQLRPNISWGNEGVV
jgi:hypothetical protein